MKNIIEKNPEILETLTAIPEFLEKYEIKESAKERFEKMKNKRMTNGSILAFIIGANIKDRHSLDEIAQMIREKINISEKKAELLAEDIQNLTKDILKTPQANKKKEKAVKEEDPYREKV